jgi:hypothetical protein
MIRTPHPVLARFRVRMRLIIALAFSVLLAGGACAGQWTTSDYGQPVVRGDGASVDIVGPSSAASGVYFTQSEETGGKYRLVVEGKLVRGAVTLRVQVDDDAPLYLVAPNGKAEYPLGPAHKVQALIYSDSAFEYRVVSIALVACPTCRSKSDVLAAAARIGNGWTIDTYNQPTVENADGTLSISAANPPAGLVFRKALNANMIYRVRVKGSQLKGRTTLRITIGKQQPSYGAAPDGDFSRIVSGASAIELLLYGDAAFTYGLQEITIEECPNCFTDEKLKNIIRGALPGIDEQARSDVLEAASRLLGWVAPILDVGDRIDVFADLSRKLPIMSASEIYSDIWQPDAGGASCSGFAVFFQKVLALFDIPAFTIDVGYEGTPLTHVTTIVPFERKFYVFDPTFGGVYVDSNGYVDLVSVIAGAGAKFRAAPISRTIMFPNDEVKPYRLMFHKLRMHPTCEREDTYTKCTSVPYSAAMVRFHWARDLKRRRIPQDADLIVALLKHKIQSVSAPDHLRERFLAAVASARAGGRAAKR